MFRGRAVVATRNSPISGPSGYVLVPLRESADFTLYGGRKHDDPSPVLAIGNDALMKTCFPCHAEASHALVFTCYAP